MQGKEGRGKGGKKRTRAAERDAAVSAGRAVAGDFVAVTAVLAEVRAGEVQKRADDRRDVRRVRREQAAQNRVETVARRVVRRGRERVRGHPGAVLRRAAGELRRPCVAHRGDGRERDVTVLVDETGEVIAGSDLVRAGIDGDHTE